MNKMIRNDLGTKWPGYEITGYHYTLSYEHAFVSLMP